MGCSLTGVGKLVMPASLYAGVAGQGYTASPRLENPACRPASGKTAGVRELHCRAPRPVVSSTRAWLPRPGRKRDVYSRTAIDGDQRPAGLQRWRYQAFPVVEHLGHHAKRIPAAHYRAGRRGGAKRSRRKTEKPRAELSWSPGLSAARRRVLLGTSAAVRRLARADPGYLVSRLPGGADSRCGAAAEVR